MPKVSVIRVRMGAEDAHYGGNLVEGAHSLKLFGDVATELMIWSDGDEGLFCAYDKVEFLAPVYAGDWIEARGWYTKIGNTSRTAEFEAWKVARPLPGSNVPSAIEVLEEPILVTKATGILVVPKATSRGKQVKEDLL